MNILSIGTATPPYSIKMEDRHEIAEKFTVSDEKVRWFVPLIMEKTTVERRHSVLLTAPDGPLEQRQKFFPMVPESGSICGPTTAERMIEYEKFAPPLALQACQSAFENCPITPADITHIVTASCTGFSAPGIDIDLIQQLGLPVGTERTNLGFMGCHAGLNCLRVAQAYTKADPQACVLVCATEICAVHYQYEGENDQRIANALFGDGSGAVIVAGSTWAEKAATDVWKIAGTGSHIMDNTYDMMTWKISDHGFRMTLSEQIPQLIREFAKDWLNEWLAGYDLTTDDIATWAVHPGGPQILHAFHRAMSLGKTDLDHSKKVLRENGNMSSATIFFVLDSMIKASEPLPCVAIGFGPGLAIEATLFR